LISINPTTTKKPAVPLVVYKRNDSKLFCSLNSMGKCRVLFLTMMRVELQKEQGHCLLSLIMTGFFSAQDGSLRLHAF